VVAPGGTIVAGPMRNEVGILTLMWNQRRSSMRVAASMWSATTPGPIFLS
jgi:hypothetical protein